MHSSALSLLRYLIAPFHFSRSCEGFRQQETAILARDGDALKVPFEYQGFGLFDTIRPKQVPEEIASLYQRIKAIAPRYIAEIGTFRGGTFYLWCRAAQSDGTLISIDAPDSRFSHPFAPARVRFYQQVFPKAPTQRLCFVNALSQDESTYLKVTEILGPAKLDFLFIDGDHTYQGVKADFERYRGLVRSEGLIAFHDILPRPELKHVEVDQFWREIKDSFPSEELIGSNKDGMGSAGIGIIRNI